MVLHNPAENLHRTNQFRWNVPIMGKNIQSAGAASP